MELVRFPPAFTSSARKLHLALAAASSSSSGGGGSSGDAGGGGGNDGITDPAGRIASWQSFQTSNPERDYSYDPDQRSPGPSGRGASLASLADNLSHIDDTNALQVLLSARR